MLHAQHPSRYDYEAYKTWSEQEDARQKEALRRFYARNAAPHYSHVTGKQISWFLVKVVFWGFLVYALVAAGFAL